MNDTQAVDARHPFAQRHAMPLPFGATLRPEGGVEFRLWAPEARQVALVEHADAGKREHPAAAAEGGWYRCDLPHATAGTRYQWRINGETDVPDPASRFNPGGPHGASEVIDPRTFLWNAGWKGRPWRETVLYEMHVGTFTAEGTYAAAEARLAELAATGVTAVELMPLSDFPGHFGWGYDGVLPYAPHAAYGRPDDLKHFIQAAHGHGLMVFLDVVYNHFGPDGNYLGLYAPQFFSKVHTNPWGNSLNFDREGSETVRAFFVQNALYWLEEYRFDGLRLDAIHAIVDDSALDVVDELALRVHERFTDRHVHLVLENENNGYQRLPSGGRYDAQWNDDFHHVMHVVLTGDHAGYYHDYGHEPVALLARSLTHGFLFEGSARTAEGARLDLRPAPAQPLGAMVNFLNNHDQSGNRAFGERMGDMAPAEAMPLATALLLLSPATPMLFVGEDFNAQTPFLYFADWQGELREAVTQGRLRDFGHFATRPDGRTDEPPSPCERSTFEASRIDWNAAEQPAGRTWRQFVAGLLAVRRECFVSRQDTLLAGAHVSHVLDEHSFVLRWRYAGGEVIELQVRIRGEGGPAPAQSAAFDRWPALQDARPLYRIGTMDDAVWGPWSARWTLGRET